MTPVILPQGVADVESEGARVSIPSFGPSCSTQSVWQGACDAPVFGLLPAVAQSQATDGLPENLKPPEARPELCEVKEELPTPSLTEPFAIGEALYDPGRVADAVVSLLDLMGVGIDKADGTPLRAIGAAVTIAMAQAITTRDLLDCITSSSSRYFTRRRAIG